MSTSWQMRCHGRPDHEEAAAAERAKAGEEPIPGDQPRVKVTLAAIPASEPAQNKMAEVRLDTMPFA